MKVYMRSVEWARGGAAAARSCAEFQVHLLSMFEDRLCRMKQNDKKVVQILGKLLVGMPVFFFCRPGYGQLCFYFRAAHSGFQIESPFSKVKASSIHSPSNPLYDCWA